MKTHALIAATAVALCAAATPAIGSIMVLGSSVGYGCYQAARAQNGSKMAVQDCDAALESGRLHFRDQVATYVNRGIVKLHGGAHSAAIADFDRAIAMDPDQPESYLNKGSTLLRMGAGAQQAIPLFDEALERRTRRPELAYFGRAIAHEASGNLKAAYLDYQRAQNAAPRWDRPATELSRFQVRRTGGTRM